MLASRALALGTLFVSLTPLSAHAAGFYVPDLGVRALGRAGAFTARADDLSAGWYNPAGLADQGGTRFLGDVGFVKQSVTYQRQDAAGSPIGFPAGNSSFPFVIPYLSVSSDFGLKNLTFAASVYGPYSGQYTYPADGPQRYSLIDSNVWEALYQMSVGWRITPWLRVGASFQIVDVRARQKLAVAALPPSGPNDASSDARVEFDVTDHVTPNAHFGLLVSPTSWLTFGASLKPPMPVKASGTLRVDQGDIDRLRTTVAGLSTLAIRGDQVGVDFTLPLVVRTGLRFHQPRWDVEVDFVYEDWSGFSKLVVKPRDIQFTLGSSTQPLTEIVQERQYGSAYSLRLGGDYEVLPGRLSVRAGFFLETTAIPTASLNTSAVDLDKHGFALGLTGRFGKGGWLGLSMGYEYVHMSETRVTNSTAEQINLTAIQINNPQIFRAPSVGSGVYRSGYDILSVGLSIDIDTLAGWTRRQ
jgi:long-chain fatty acid transport protein